MGPTIGGLGTFSGPALRRWLSVLGLPSIPTYRSMRLPRRTFRERLFIMLVAILIPEMLISAAWRQRADALEASQEIPNGSQWTHNHARQERRP